MLNSRTILIYDSFMDKLQGILITFHPSTDSTTYPTTAYTHNPTPPLPYYKEQAANIKQPGAAAKP
jgi:hypothetical protein